MLNNAKPYFFLNEMNKKDLLAMHSTAFWCLIVVYCFFFALLRNHCYSFYERRSNTAVARLVTVRRRATAVSNSIHKL